MEGHPDHNVVIAITRTRGNQSPYIQTGLGWMEEDGRAVIPFSSYENAIDCLRVLIRTLERERDSASSDIR